MTQKVLPALDDKLDATICKKTDGLIKETGAMLISDGWTSIQSRPIINALLSTAVGSQLIKARHLMPDKGQGVYRRLHLRIDRAERT